MNDLNAFSTIAALATPPGRGGLAVVRLSGPLSETILNELFVPATPGERAPNRVLRFGHLVHQGRTLDECLAVIMRAPHSYTREDVVEFQLHGGELVVKAVLDAVFALGARPAQAGEFTRRAFENGRVDLSQAEAVMQLVSATGRQAAHAALRQLQGGTLQFVKDAQQQLISLMAGVTAAIDYPEEISQEEAVGNIAPALKNLGERLLKACDERGAKILEEGLQVVLCGKPNAGKSSLLNALLGEERAIVTDIPGTTRDTISGSFEIDGIRVHLTDTAGIRQTGETVERLGVGRALNAIQSADLRLMVLDNAQAPGPEDEEVLEHIRGMENLYLLNKSDLGEHPGFTTWLSLRKDLPPDKTLTLSAHTGRGLGELRTRLRELAGNPGENTLTLARHMGLARQAANSLEQAAKAMVEGLPLDLAAVDLNDALASLGEITGDNTSEALLDQVFSSFCVGK